MLSPSFFRLSASEARELAHGGGADGWSVGRVLEALEHPALNDFYILLDHDVEQGYKAAIHYYVGTPAQVRAWARPLDLPAEVFSAEVCACLSIFGVRGRDSFEVTTSYMYISPDGKIQRSVGLPASCAEVSPEGRDWLAYDVDRFFAVLVGIQLALMHSAVVPTMCGRCRASSLVPMPRGSSRAPGRVKVYKLSAPAGGLADALRSLPAEPVPRVRHCAAWGVRGHYRRLKSGVQVYVRPHVRGPEREAGAPGREYLLCKEEI